LTKSNAQEKGLVGLWAIRKVAGEAGMTVSTVDLAMFIQLAFEQKVNERSLRESLRKTKDKAINTKGTMFHITPTGVSHVESLIKNRFENSK